MTETVELLDELGIRRGCIVETIVATRDADGFPRAAPMGVVRVDPDILEIKPFKSSLTYRNMLRDKEACVNLTEDPELFLVSAFKHENLQGFSKPHIEENLSIRSADASIFVEILNGCSISEERGCFICQVQSVEMHRPYPRVFSRGRAEAIEAVVHTTRIKPFLCMGRLGDAEKLIKRFNECKEVVERVSSPESAEVKVMRVLEALIGDWRGRASRQP